MRVAALDLGTNSFLCLVADIEKDSLKIVNDTSEFVRLGQDVNATQTLQPEALMRAEAALSKFSQIIKTLNVSQVGAVATSAARDAKNSNEFFSLTQKYNIPVRIISGNQEAVLTFNGSVEPNQRTGTAVIDVGGGSTEIVAQTPSGALISHSFQIGCVRLFEHLHLAPPFSPNKIALALQQCREIFAKVPLNAQDVHHVVAVAGTPTTLAAMDQGVEFSVDRVENYKLTRNGLLSWAQRLAHMNATEIAQKYNLNPLRADVLPAGAIVLASALDHLQHAECRASTRGVRFGLAWELATEESNGRKN